MNSESSETTIQIQDALANAVMVVASVRTDYFVNLLNQQSQGSQYVFEMKWQTGDNFLAEATDDGCLWSSEIAAYYLLTKIPELFTEVFLMQGVSTERIRLSNYLNMHWVCVLKDIQGIYSLLSPSNHLVGEKSMFEIFEATEIDQILNQLCHSESGIWPTVKFLKSHYRTPQITPKGIQVPKFKFDNRKQMKLSIDNITESVFGNPF